MNELNDVFELVKIYSSFWQDVIKSWCSFQFNDPYRIQEIAEQVIWLNSHIKIQKKLIFNKSMFNVDIWYIKDLMDNGVLLNYMNFKIKYPNIKVNYVVYYGIIEAIPASWRLKLRNVNNLQPMVHDKLHKITNTKGTISSWVYQNLISKFAKFPQNTVTKWDNILETNFAEPDWKTVFSNIYHTTISTNLRAFQFKFLHRILATKRQLYIWKIVEDEKCSFCKELPETDIHLFWECHFVAEFWSKVERWYESMTGINIHFNKSNVMLSLDLDHIPALDIIILVAKQYIFNCSRNNTMLYLNNFIEHIKIIKDIEHVIAYKIEK